MTRPTLALCSILLALFSVPQLDRVHAQKVSVPQIRYESVPDFLKLPAFFVLGSIANACANECMRRKADKTSNPKMTTDLSSVADRDTSTVHWQRENPDCYLILTCPRTKRRSIPFTCLSRLRL